MSLFSSSGRFLKKTNLQLAFLLMGLLCFSGAVHAQDVIPKKTLTKLKDATVFIRVSQGRQGGTGSGFLFKKDKKFAYIITNEHVVRKEGRVERVVEVDFYSGTANRRAMPAEVVSEDDSRDLAVLKVANEDLPEPIDLKSSKEIVETQSVFILGFPFGDALATNRRGPNVTIGKGTISSIRTDNFGAVEFVQIDGDINPGNSGGPIVFADGTMMGVSVATVVGTQIGIGIPGESVLDLLEGRISRLSISQSSPGPKRVVCDLEAGLIDPMGAMKNISILYIDASELRETELRANEDGRWGRISPKMKEARFEVEGQIGSAQISFRGDYGERKHFIHQIKFVNGRGEKLYTGPGEYTAIIPEKNGQRGNGSPPRRSTDREAENETENAEENPNSGKGWLGRDKGDADNGDGARPEPTAANNSVLGEEFKCLDANCKRLNFEFKKPVANMVWDSTHDHFYILLQEGLLRKISYPELTEVATLELESECKWMAMAETGLCILNSGMQDLLVLDPLTLEVQNTFAVGEATTFAATPVSENIYVRTKGHLLVMNSRNGKHVREYRANDFELPEGRLFSLDKPALTPDGKHLLCLDGTTSAIVCFRVRGSRLTYDGKTGSIGRNLGNFEISSDSSYVALPAGGGNGKGYTTYVYEVDNLSEHVIEVNSGAYPRALGFDQTAGLLYAQNHDNELLTINGNGSVRKAYDLSRNGNSHDFLVHPDGNQLVVLTGGEVIVVNLPSQ